MRRGYFLSVASEPHARTRSRGRKNRGRGSFRAIAQPEVPTALPPLIKVEDLVFPPPPPPPAPGPGTPTAPPTGKQPPKDSSLKSGGKQRGEFPEQHPEVWWRKLGKEIWDWGALAGAHLGRGLANAGADVFGWAASSVNLPRYEAQTKAAWDKAKEYWDKEVARTAGVAMDGVFG